jgi:Fic family protein
MAVTKPHRDRIQKLKREFDRLSVGKDALLTLIDEAEVPEAVYNSNAIENSTLTLKETERILLEQEVAREVSVREVFEAKNLARVVSYMHGRSAAADAPKATILLLHQMLIGGINDDIAGRFRQKGEYVRVGSHIAPAPEAVETLLDAALAAYASDRDAYFVDGVARFHLEFERIHPFVDGNGRIGRALINWQLGRAGFPPIIIRDKEKQEYYRAFRESGPKKARVMEKIVALALTESLHKRIAYVSGAEIVSLTEYARQSTKPAGSIFNAARRQTIPAFREKGAWKIAKT